MDVSVGGAIAYSVSDTHLEPRYSFLAKAIHIISKGKSSLLTCFKKCGVEGAQVLLALRPDRAGMTAIGPRDGAGLDLLEIRSAFRPTPTRGAFGLPAIIISGMATQPSHPIDR